MTGEVSARWLFFGVTRLHSPCCLSCTLLEQTLRVHHWTAPIEDYSMNRERWLQLPAQTPLVPFLSRCAANRSCSKLRRHRHRPPGVRFICAGRRSLRHLSTQSPLRLARVHFDHDRLFHLHFHVEAKVNQLKLSQSRHLSRFLRLRSARLQLRQAQGRAPLRKGRFRGLGGL